jgi:hypothetical protein
MDHVCGVRKKLGKLSGEIMSFCPVVVAMLEKFVRQE